MGLPTLPDGWTYHCSTPADYRKIDGTGWIPVIFNSLTSGSPFGVLPVDPVNTTSTGLYYTYTYSNGQWAATTLFESTTYQEKYAATQSGSSTMTVYTTGNSPSPTPAVLLARGGGGGGGGSTLSTPYVWIVDWNGNFVTKLDDSSGSLIGTYPLGSSSWRYGIAVDASGNIWVSNYDGNSVTKLNSSGAVIGTYTVGSHPYGIAIDASGNVWAAKAGENSITKLDSSGNLIGKYTVSASYSLGDMTGFALQYFVLGWR